MDKPDWQRIKEDHEVAYFKAELSLNSPESYSIDEKMEIIQGMEDSTAEVDATMRAEFEALPPKMQAKMFEGLVNSGVESPEFWTRILLD